MSMSRVLSLIVFFVYVTVLLIGCIRGEEDASRSLLMTVGFLVLPLACIWFPDEVGGWMGLAGHGQVTSPSASWAVVLLGWIILLLPGIVFICLRIYQL